MLALALSAKEVANNLFDHIVNPLMAGMLFIAILFFIIIAIKLIAGAESTDRKDLFRKLGWSITGIFIIASVWTIITLVKNLAESDIQFSVQYLAKVLCA